MSEYQRIMRQAAMRRRVEHVLQFLAAAFIASCLAALFYWLYAGRF